MQAETVRAHAIVRGRVQGVYFRSSTQRQAESLGLSGWVRNLPDGEVEIVFEGPRNAVERGLAWAAIGPGPARVDQVKTTWEEPRAEHGFSVR